jgi:MinD superfamily P-loop ATPase
VSSTEVKKKGTSTDAKPQTKRVVFTMGGKGGTGKTSCMLALAEWFESNHIPFTLLDLDIENKARGSLKHYFNGAEAAASGWIPRFSRISGRCSRGFLSQKC